MLKQIGLVLCAGGLLGALAVSLITVPSQTAYSQIRPANTVAEGLLQVSSTMLPTGIEQITVVDPIAKSMAVYHIEPATAKIQLKSVRSLLWDLQMEHFNGQTPLPSELRQVQP